jgi:hypothetical protein
MFRAMAIDPRLEFAADALKLRGPAKQVMTFVAAFFVVGGILAAGLDLADSDGWDPATLQSWTLVSQTLAAVGLLLLGRWRKSLSFTVLGVLITLIVIEEAFHVLNPVSAWLADVADIENRWNTVRLSVLNGVLIYGFVAILGVALLLVSHWRGTPAERRVVRNIAILLVIGGIFGGPISTASYWVEDTRRVIFIEEVGESLVFAAMVGYVAALVVETRRRSVAATASPRRRPIRGPGRP